MELSDYLCSRSDAHEHQLNAPQLSGSRPISRVYSFARLVMLKSTVSLDLLWLEILQDRRPI